MVSRALILAILLSVVCFAIPTLAGSVFVPPLITIAKSGAPSNASDGPAAISWFATPEGLRTPSEQTEVRLSYDDKNLYMAFRCMESKMSKLSTRVTERDGMLWRDDSIEVFLAPLPDSRSYFHIIVNAAGVQYDEKDKVSTPESWNGEWSVVTKTEPDAWTAIVTMPFASLGVNVPADGTVWGANFARHEIPHAEMSCWSIVGRSFHAPERFGQIAFGGSNPPLARLDRIDISSPGNHQATLHIVPSSTVKSFTAYILLDGKMFVPKAHGAPEAMDRRADISISGEGRHTLSLTVTGATPPGTYLRTPILPINIPAHAGTLNQYRNLVSRLSPPTKAAAQEKAAILQSLDKIAELAENALGSNSRWNELGDRLAAIESDVSHVRYSCADKRGSGYVLGSETPLRKIMRDRFFQGTLGGPARISAARNDHEAAQVAVIAYDKALAGVSVSLSAFEGPNGVLLPSDRVTLSLVDYVKTRPPVYAIEYVGWYPDPLMPMAIFDVPKGSVQPVWITVHPSEKTPAGIYRGELTVTPSNAPASTIPVELRVWDFALPRENHLKTAFTFNEAEVRSWYGRFTPEMRRTWYQFLLDHRISPMSLYTTTPVPAKQYLPFCVERGLNAFNLSYVRSTTDTAKLAELIRDYQSFLGEHDWSELAYVYGFDEIKKPNYGELKEKFGFIKEEFPHLKTVCTVIPNEDLKGYVDIWVPLTAGFKLQDAKEYGKNGDEVWWYVCCGPLHPYANFFVDYPAIDPRILFWMNWKYQVPGFLYYTITNWWSNRMVENLPANRVGHDDPKAIAAIKAGKRWPEVPWNTWTYGNFNGDGHLVYPGLDGSPVSSIRFECIRDGIEDYEAFYLLNQLVQSAHSGTDKRLLARAKRLLAVDDKVVKTVAEYTLDPDVLMKTRQEVAEMIEKLRERESGGKGEREKGRR